MPKVEGKAGLEAELKAQGISIQQMVDHDAVVTVEEMMEKASSLLGGKAKNLFFKDKKKNMVLVSALHDTPTSPKFLEQAKGDAALFLTSPEF